MKDAKDLKLFFDQNNIFYQEHNHAPLFTVTDSQSLRGTIAGSHIKNLFLRDKKHRLWLASVEESCMINLKGLKQLLSASGSLSFASAERLWDILGIKPGAVSPFGLINDESRIVQPIIDAQLLKDELINAHPLRNDQTMTIKIKGLMQFYQLHGYQPLVVDFSTMEVIDQRSLSNK